jgi:hypothetical protein
VFRSGWLWLIGAAEQEGLRAWHRKRRMRVALELLDGRHPNEKPLWLRWSHSGATVEELLESWHRYSVWWRRSGPAIDLLGVTDRGSQGERIWHIHGYGYGPGIDIAEHAERWGRAGGFPFVKVERAATTAELHKYVLAKLRGYLDRKTGCRRLSLKVRR